jgi:hypothetical protein
MAAGPFLCFVSMGRNTAAVFFLLLAFAGPSSAASSSVDGIFSALWYSKQNRLDSEKQFGPWLYHNYYEDEQEIGSVEYWKKEVKDMDRAGFKFIAPYSFGREMSPGSDPVNWSALAKAISSSGSSLKMAYFSDTSGLQGRSARDGTPGPFDLSRGEAAWRKYIYEEDMKRFFDTIPRDTQYFYQGRPLVFYYTSNSAFLAHRELAGQLLAKIHDWFSADYGVDPFIVTDIDWLDGQPSGAKAEILANTSGFYSWSFMAAPGAGPFPGGGIVRSHPRTGLTMGTAGVGYSYQGGPGNAPRFRDRRDGQTLIGDWTNIRGANIRMVAAWMDLEEASGICRTKEYDYQYIDIMSDLICPGCRAVCDPTAQPKPHWGAKNGQCAPSCGLLGGTAAYADDCANHGMVSAGTSYDVAFCCRDAAAAAAASAVLRGAASASIPGSTTAPAPAAPAPKTYEAPRPPLPPAAPPPP